MKFFTNKSIWAKMLIIFAIVLLLFFLIAKPVHAEESSFMLDGFGKLIQPFVSLVVTLADTIMNTMQSAIMGIQVSMIPIDLNTSIWDVVLSVILVVATIIVAVCAVVGLVASGVGIPALIAGIAKIIVTATIVNTIGVTTIRNVADSMNVASKDLPDQVSIASYTNDLQLPSTLYLPAFAISPEEIFQGKILLFNIDFFGEPTKIYAKGTDAEGNEASALTTDDDAMSELKDIEYYYYNDTDSEGNTVEVKTSKQDIAADLSSTVSRWYVAIRNIVLVLMMIVLLYIGIRMLLSTLANDKAKYRQMLMDWFVGLLILFFIHYIMAFAVTVVQNITDVISSSIDSKMYSVMIPADKGGKMVDFLNSEPHDPELRSMALDTKGNKILINGDEEITDQNFGYLLYPTNLIGQIRLQAQLANYGTESIGYSLCYLILVLFTFFFAFTYLKRVLYMAFLTLIAPIVSLTYPIDKINDGQAQGFNKWFREYIFNLLLQPLHLLLYYVLVASAFQLSSTNIIYSIVAIGFMIPAEKILRSFFGFGKSETAGAFGGVAGAAVVMSGLKNIASIGRRKTSTDNKKELGDNNKIRENQQVSGSDDVDEGEVAKKSFGQKTGEFLMEHGEGILDNAAGAATGAVATAAGMAGAIATSQANDLPNENAETANIREANRELTPEQIADMERQDKLANQPFGLGEIEADTKRKIKSQPKSERAKKKVYKMAQVVSKYGVPTIRGAGKVIGTVGGATIGIAAGVATGDLSNVATYGGAGAVAGNTIGKNAFDLEDGSAAGRAKLNRAYQRLIARNEGFREAENNRLIKQKIKEAQEVFLDNGYDKDMVEQMAYDGTLGRYAANNISTKDMVTIENMKKEMKKENKVLSTEQGIAIAKLNQKYGEGLSTPGSRKETREAIGEYFREKKQATAEEAKVLEKGTTEYIDKFRKQGKKVTDLGSK